jgi:hypothetical protein
MKNSILTSVYLFWGADILGYCLHLGKFSRVVEYHKIISNISEIFSSLLDEAIAKICEKFNFEGRPKQSKNGSKRHGVISIFCILLLGMPQGTRGTRSPRSPDVFPRPDPQEI